MTQMFKNYGLYILVAILVIAFWDAWFVKPFKFFAVMVHEYSHALAAILTGGTVVEIRTFWENGGHMRSYGGFRPIVSSAGYVGSALIGAFFLYSVGWLALQRILLFILGSTSIVLTFIYSPFGELDYWIGIAGGAVLILTLFSKTAANITANWIGVILLLFSLEAFRGPLWIQPEQTDAGILARHWGMPFLTVPIAITWVIFSIFVMYLALRANLRKAANAIESEINHSE